MSSSSDIMQEARPRRPFPRGINRPWNRSNPLAHLPGDDGLPILGHTVQYMQDQSGFHLDRYRKYGPLFSSTLFMNRSVTLCDADAANEILRDKERMFSSMHGWDYLIGAFVGGGLMLRDFDDHRLHRRVLQEAFKKPQLAGYLDTMTPTIASQIAEWGRRGEFLFYPSVKKLTLNLAGQVFTGMAPGAELDRINQAFVDLMSGAFALVRQPVPGLAHWRGLRGRAALERLFDDLLDGEAAGGTDLLSHLREATSPEGDRLTRDEIVDHMVFMMLAAHDTTTSALTNLCWMLAANPDWQDRLRQLYVDLGKDELDYDDLDALEEVDWALLETLRLFPPVSAIPRMPLRDWEFGGYTVPRDTIIWVSAYVIQRREDYWTDAERFDPDRFSPEREEHRAHPGVFNPYSSGPHICLGMQFSKVQVKAVLHRLLLDYRLHLQPGAAKSFQLTPFPKPADDLPIRLERIGPAHR